MNAGAGADPGRSLAVAAQSMVLVNLLAAPGLAFLVLAWLWATRRRAATPLARHHLEQAFAAAWRGGLVLVGGTGGFAWLGGFDKPWTWVVVVTWFTCVHASLVVLGLIALSRAMAGRRFVYPLIGPRDA